MLFIVSRTMPKETFYDEKPPLSVPFSKDHYPITIGRERHPELASSKKNSCECDLFYGIIIVVSASAT